MTGFESKLAAALFCCAFLPGGSAETLDQTLARMDNAADGFRSMTAKVRRVSYLAVLNADDVYEGTTALRRTKRDVRVLVHFTSPDDKSVALSGTKIESYLPKLNVVQEYDFGSHQQVEKFLSLGFGASGADLRRDYALKALGDDTVNGEKTSRIELTPKDKAVLQQFPKIELWIPLTKGYPVQQKLYQRGGDYMLITYSDVAINPPLPDSAFKLNLPKGVKREFPQK
jgi:outer membrane lipoprotein-sorting protein